MMTEQPMPTPSDRASMHDLVCDDMQARKAVGLDRYGSLLQTFNGRDFGLDAYEEVLDLAVYLRGLRAELEAIRPVVAAAVAWRGNQPADPASGVLNCDRGLVAAVDAYREAGGT